jgi:hypothetical protein
MSALRWLATLARRPDRRPSFLFNTVIVALTVNIAAGPQ